MDIQITYIINTRCICGYFNAPKTERFLTNENLSEYKNYPITDTEMIVPSMEGYMFLSYL